MADYLNGSGNSTTADASTDATTTTDEAGSTILEPYDLDLSAGHYTGGLGIPTGKYNITWVSGNGNVISPGKVNEIFGDRDGYVKEFNNFDFSKGTVLELKGDVIVHIHSDSADFSNIKQREITTEVETVLSPGLYQAGLDFSVGTYFISAYEGSGNVISHGASVNEIVSAEPRDNYIYQYNYATFAEGTDLEIKGCTVKLIPAGA